MYKNILRESGSYLSVLIVDESCDYRDMLEKKLSKYFKAFMYASNYEEAFLLHEDKPFDIVIVDVDRESVNGLDLITKLKNVNSSQTIFAYSEQIENPSLLLNLLNIGITCFINKVVKVENYFEIISNVCQYKCDQKMLALYIEELEQVNNNIVRTQDSIEEDDFEFFPAPSEEEDDFEFFPTPSEETTSSIVENSLYKDYFNFLDPDDKEDLIDLLHDIDLTLINAFSDTGSDPVSIEILGSFLMKFGNILMNYQFFSDMAMAILEFGKVTSEEYEKVAAGANSFHSLIGGFCSGLQVFIIEVWEKESDNPKYFNDSIINDARLIIDLIVPPAVVDSDDDLVFF